MQTEFDAFWKNYPRRTGKLAAEKAYGKARKIASAETILAGIEQYRAHKPEYADWCHPATWLNQGRWMDEWTTTPTSGCAEWVCSHEPRCGNRQTCALVTSRHCPHHPKCENRNACLERLLA